MRSLPVQLDDDTLEALEMERRLIGFDSRDAYVRWIIEHRASIADTPDDAATLLDTYRERIATVEQQLADRTDWEPGGDGTADDTESTSVASGGGQRTPTTAGDGAARSAQTSSSQDNDGWTRSKSHPSVEVRGTPRTTVSRKRPPASTDRSSTDEREAATHQESDRKLSPESAETATEPPSEHAETATEPPSEHAETTTESPSEHAETATESPSVHSETATESPSEHAETPIETSARLSPERVVRIKGDPVTEDADVLDSVEFDRLDELSRRAVAQTRSRLNRSVETGLTYRSSTPLVDDGVRPGADVVDLDSLAVPGHDEELIEARREVAGRAIAFLRDERQARKSDFVDALYDGYSAGYETADSWWGCLKTALKQVDAIEGGDGRRVWEFTG